MKLLILSISLLLASICQGQIINASSPYRVRASGGYDADAQAYFDALATAGYTASTAEKDAYNTFVTTLKTASLYTTFKAIYPLLGGASAPCAINAKNPGTYNISWTGCTFNSTGVDFNGTSDFGDCNFNPSSHLSGLSVAIGFYSRQNTAAADKIDIGATDGTNPIYIGIKYNGVGGGDQIGRAFNTLVSSAGVTSDTRGLFTTTSNGTTCTLYANASSNGSGTGGGTATNANLTLGKWNGVGQFTDRECGFAFIYDGNLSSGNMTTLYNAIQDLMTAWSRNV